MNCNNLYRDQKLTVLVYKKQSDANNNNIYLPFTDYYFYQR